MVQIGSGEGVGDYTEPTSEPAALAGGVTQYQRAQRSQLARLEQVTRIDKQIAHLLKASDRLALAPIDDATALQAMDTINFEIEQLAYERTLLQIEADLSLAEALVIAHRSTALTESLLSLPSDAICEALWSLYDEVDGDPSAFAGELGLDPSHPDAAFLFNLVHTTIGERP